MQPGSVRAGASVQRGRGRGALSSHVNQDGALHDQLDRIVGTLVKLVAK